MYVPKWHPNGTNGTNFDVFYLSHEKMLFNQCLLEEKPHSLTSFYLPDKLQFKNSSFCETNLPNGKFVSTFPKLLFCNIFAVFGRSHKHCALIDEPVNECFHIFNTGVAVCGSFFPAPGVRLNHNIFLTGCNC